MNPLNFSELEIIELQKFLENPTLKGAVKGALLDAVHFNEEMLAVAQKEELSDEQIGAVLRATGNAYLLIKKGFENLEKYKKIKKITAENINPAR